jgi:serine/threonine protein phosphatase PrpC
MITCPECGQECNEDAKFCDRCGQGLAGSIGRPAVVSISPLDPHTELRGGYQITEVLNRTARENRYRAVRRQDDERVQLREQPGPGHQLEAPALPESSPAPTDEDPAGPRAKTAELRLEPSNERTSRNGSGEQASQSDSTNDAASRNAGEEPNVRVSPALHESSEHTIEAQEAPSESGVHLLTEAIDHVHAPETSTAESSTPESALADDSGLASVDGQMDEAKEASPVLPNDDLGELFGRVLSLSITLNHPGFQRATAGFADDGRVYLVYPDEELRSLSSRAGGLRMDEAEALQIAIQVCQSVSVLHRRGLRVNDICPDSVSWSGDGRIKLTGLDYVSNDNELQSEPIFNDGYTAPEIYHGKKVDKRADVFSIGALLYTCVTGERLDSETWREEAGLIHFYPPHVVTPVLEQILRRALQFDPAARWPNVEALKVELVKLAATVRIRAETLTDVGRVREHNEDSVLAFELKRDSLIDPAQVLLYVVADGMGGAEAGEIASAIAVDAIRNSVESKLKLAQVADGGAILREALEHANLKIIEYQAAHPEARSMGSTAVAALVNPPEAGIAWVGDSRAYIFDGRALRQLSKDHSLVQRLLEIGQITPVEAAHHEHKNVITRSLGARPTGPAGAESLTVRLKRGDRLLLCSDGLTAHVEEQQIAEVLQRHCDPTAAARELVVAANAGGGTDNVSVVVIIVG